MGMSYINDLWRRNDNVQVEPQPLAECRCPFGVEERREGRVLSRVLHLRQARKATQRGALGHRGLRDQIAARHFARQKDKQPDQYTSSRHNWPFRGSPPEVV